MVLKNFYDQNEYIPYRIGWVNKGRLAIAIGSNRTRGGGIAGCITMWVIGTSSWSWSWCWSWCWTRTSSIAILAH